MADEKLIVGESREQIAYRLLKHIAFVEGKAIAVGDGGQKADRNYILSTFYECWDVVTGTKPK